MLDLASAIPPLDQHPTPVSPRESGSAPANGSPGTSVSAKPTRSLFTALRRLARRGVGLAVHRGAPG
jgi:hypothetical protein